MTDKECSDVDVEQINQLLQAFERFDNTGDVDVLAEHLAEDVVFMPPGDPPIGGKDAVEESLQEFPSDRFEFDVEQPSEQLLVSNDLAVNRASVTGSKVPKDGGEPESISHKGLDVFRKGPDGSWKIAISIWNDQA